MTVPAEMFQFVLRRAGSHDILHASQFDYKSCADAEKDGQDYADKFFKHEADVRVFVGDQHGHIMTPEVCKSKYPLHPVPKPPQKKDDDDDDK